MFREFNVKFEDVEMLGGTDNLLENTEITKVIVRGDNNKMSSLDSMLKNCNELDTIDGELDLNDVSDIDNLLENTELVRSISLKNINNENISANNSFPHIEEMNIGGELYNKKAMQNVIASREWTFDNITYDGIVGDNVTTKEVNVIDDNKVTIQDTLEQKARGFEIIGQTYENLVVGNGEVTLLDELTLESIDGSTKEFNPHIEQPVCVETIEGETYQNLVNGKGEYKLTDTFSSTWIESNNSIDNPPSMIEIPEIWGNTIQGYVNAVTSQQVVDAINKNMPLDVGASIHTTNEEFFTTKRADPTKPTNSDNFIQLKPNTTYTVRCYRFGSTQTPTVYYYLGDSYSTTKIVYWNKTLTTDSTGKILFYPASCQDGQLYLRVVEGEVDLASLDYKEKDLNYIQSLGDLYVDENNDPMLDEEGNEQYKLDIFSYDYKYMPETSDNRTGLSGTTKDGDWSVINHNIGDYTRYSTTNKTINRADYGDLVYASFKIVKLDDRKYNHTSFCTRDGGYAYHFMTKNEYNDLPVNVEHFQSAIQSELHPDGSMLNITFCEYSKELELSCKVKDIVLVNLTKWFGKGNEPTREWCDENIKYVEHEDGEILYGNKNETTILMPQPLRKINDDLYDKLYWDYEKNKYLIQRKIGKYFIDSNTNIRNYTVKQMSVYNIHNCLPNAETIGEGWVYKAISPNFKKNHKVGGDWRDVPSIFGDAYNGGKDVSYSTPNMNLNSVSEFRNYCIENNIYVLYPIQTEIIETKILEKLSLETYSPKTYISTNSEVQPSQMAITNKKTIFKPLGLSSNLEYTIQLDSIGKNDKNITVNLGGTETTIQPVNDTNKHHKFTVRTPATLTNETLELSGEGVTVNDVMLLQGGSNEIKQEVEYIDDIENIGEVQICKNLFPNTPFILGKFLHNDGSLADLSDTSSTVDFVECNLDADKHYSISCNYNYIKLVFYDNNKKFISYKSSNTNNFIKGFNVPANAKYYRICCSTTNTSDINLQIEEGNDITEYQEYFEGKQYKIDILSHEGGLSLTNISYDYLINTTTYGLDGWTCVILPFKSNDTFTIKKKNRDGSSDFRYCIFNTVSNTSPARQNYVDGKFMSEETITWKSDGNWVGIGFVTDYKNDLLSKTELSVLCDNNKIPKYIQPIERNSTQSILIPQPLNKIGEIKDKFYWDDNKGHYCLEQRFAREKANGLNWTMFNQNDNFIHFKGSQLLNTFKHSDKGLCNKLACYQQYSLSAMNKEGISLRGNTMDIVLSKARGILSIEQLQIFINDLFVIWELEIPQIIDLPHLNKKYSLDTYMPTTYLECINSPMQPSRLLLESDTVRYKPSALETDTDYTIQFECKEKSDKKVKLNLGGSEKEVDVEVGLNHVSITTPSEIDASLYKDRLFLSGAGNTVADVMVVKGEMKQYPEYFDGVQSTGELQNDGTYRIGIETNCGEGLDFSNTKPTMIINQNGNMANDSYVTSEGYLCILRNDGGYGYNQLYGFFDTDSIGIPRGVDCYVSYRTLYMIIKDIGRVNLTNQPNRYGVVVDSSSNYVTGSNGGITTGVINIPNDGARYYLRTQVSYDGYALQNNTCQEFCLIYNCMPTNLPVTLENFKPIKKHKTSITSNNPLAKGDKLYWNKSNKRYEIDRGGSVEVPTVTGDVIDLPRLYQRENTYFSTSTGNIKPSKIKLDYNDLD